MAKLRGAQAKQRKSEERTDSPWRTRLKWIRRDAEVNLEMPSRNGGGLAKGKTYISCAGLQLSVGLQLKPVARNQKVGELQQLEGGNSKRQVALGLQGSPARRQLETRWCFPKNQDCHANPGADAEITC